MSECNDVNAWNDIELLTFRLLFHMIYHAFYFAACGNKLIKNTAQNYEENTKKMCEKVNLAHAKSISFSPQTVF